MDRRTKVHFLHIGKNAGTQLKAIAKQINEISNKYRIVTHHHGIKLSDIPEGEVYFFSIRNPVSRFSSVFYGHKRKDQRRLYVEWMPYEKRTFEQFEDAADLAEALFQDDKLGADAFCAMKSVSHVSMNQIDWFDKRGFFLQERPPVAIIRQENFEEDLTRLLDFVGITRNQIAIASDNTKAHKTNYKDKPPISDKGKANLEKWYVQDLELYRQCCQWLKDNT